MLISAGANLNITTPGGLSVLLVSILKGYVDIVKLLIEANVNLNSVNK